MVNDFCQLRVDLLELSASRHVLTFAAPGIFQSAGLVSQRHPVRVASCASGRVADVVPLGLVSE
jgi:hypothetical protein